MKRDEIELSDTFETLGINPISQKVVETADSINIFLWRIHQESLTLAKAITLLCDSNKYKINVILVDIRNMWRYVFDWKDFHVCNFPDKFHYVQFRNIWDAVIYWDAFRFLEYVNDKFLTWIILRMNNIKVPLELVFKKRHNKKWVNKEQLEKIDTLFWTNKHIVLKPSIWECWNWVHILSKEDIWTDFYNNYIEWNDTVLLQEKIDSYPIVINDVRKDWNLRVLVTFDVQTKKYIVVWMIWRIDDDWKPINISKSANYISFEEISKLANWTAVQCEKIKQDIIDLAIKSVTVIVNRVSGNKSEDSSLTNHQTIAWVDIIVNNDIEPVVIEVNSANSGWVYKLMKYEWIDAITPIAYSIILKSLIAQRIIEKTSIE